MMVRKTVVSGLLVAVLALSASASAAPPRLHLTTETSAPISMLDGKRVVGVGTDKIREAMSRAGIDYTIELLPWKRAYGTALQRKDGCVFSTTRTPERERLFKWIGPTDSAQWVLMARADTKLRLGSLEDARSLRIGTYNGDAREQFLRDRGFAVDSAPSDLMNPRKLLLGRIDLWAASLRVGSKVLAKHGWDTQIVPVLVFNKIDVYLACNRAVPDELVGRLNAQFEAMARDGTMERIERRYDDWDVGLAEP